MSRNFPAGLNVTPDGAQNPTFAVDKYGNAHFAGSVAVDGQFSMSGGGSLGLTLGNNEFLSGLTTSAAVKRLIGVNSSDLVSIDTDAAGVVFGAGGTFAGTMAANAITSTTTIVATTSITATTTILGTTGVLVGASDVALTRVSAGILKLANAALTTSIRVHGDASKYLSLGHDGTNGIISASSGSLSLQSAALGWAINTTGVLYPLVDGTQALGDAAFRAANVFSVLGTLGVSTNLTGILYAGSDAAATAVFDTAVTSAVGSSLSFRKARGTQAARTIVASGDTIGEINFYGIEDATDYRTAAQIIGKVGGTPGATTDMPGSLEFYTTPEASVTPLLRFKISASGALEVGAAGGQLLATTAAYGVGTAYALTNTAAAIDFGTTDPAVVIPAAGTYMISGQVNLAYTGATVVAETATIKVRRTNNTAADLSAVVVLDLPVSTTLTHTFGIFQIPPFTYTTALTDDAVTLFANVSAALGAGTIDATAIGTSIVVTRIS